MAHELIERYSKLVLAKIRQELKLKDGIVFNNDYEGDPKAGSVKIPVRDTEVAVSDYDKANGIQGTHGSTGYETLTINRDKAVNEIIDGYDAQAVPDNLVADRLDSAGYSLARALDNDGASTLISSATHKNVSVISKDTIYAEIVDLRTDMNKANIPNDNKRYLLVTPDAEALILKSPEFVSASNLGDEVKQAGAIGRIAGFNVIPWNDSTVGLKMIAGHPRFATRVKEWAVDPHVQDLSGSGKYIGASAVQGRQVYAHKVLRSVAIRALFSPSVLGVSCVASDAGKTVATVTGASGTLKYRLNPVTRASFGDATSSGFSALTSGTTKITANAGDVIEVVELGSDGKVVSAGYATAVVG